jgi:glycine hydroxymethyltransferase
LQRRPVASMADPEQHADFVYDQIEQHHDLFGTGLPMIASENCISPTARRLLASDFHDRYAEGRPGKRYYQGLEHVDEVERRCEQLASELFDAAYTDTRPTAGTTANMAVFFARTEPGDTVLTLDTDDGAHISHAPIGAAGLRGLNVEKLPADPDRLTVDADRAADQIREVEPDVVLLGQSLFLFPAPVEQLAGPAAEVGADLVYDGAHVLGLIGGGQFQDPLREGADVVTASTHKTLPGPQGGIVLSDKDPEEAESFTDGLDKGVFPGTVSNHHLHHMAAKTVAFAEHLAFGEDYAEAIVESSQALAGALAERGLTVLCEEHGYTESHQVAVDVGDHGGGKQLAQRLEEAGIICNMNMIPGDENPFDPSGLRLGTQELVRTGMGPDEMDQVAEFYARVILKDEAPDSVAEDVAAFADRFDEVHYCFDPGQEAYRFWELS